MSRTSRNQFFASSGASGSGLNVEEVFSTNVYEHYPGPASEGIANDIDRYQDTGMMFMGRRRKIGVSTIICDTLRGEFKNYTIFQSPAEDTQATWIYGTRANGGMVLNSSYGPLVSGGDKAVVWMFKQVPKFFDQFEYTGNGVNGRTLNHNLDDTPGMIVIKARTTTQSFITYVNTHPTQELILNGSAGAGSIGSSKITNVSSTSFDVTNDVSVNDTGINYTCYLFANNNNTGNFGLTANQDIIKTGTYTGNGNPTYVDVGFVPQWLLIKRTDGSGSWYVADMMRGFVRGIDNNPAQSPLIQLNNQNIESDVGGVYPYYGSNGEKGFAFNDQSSDLNGTNSVSSTLFYMAIRRPMAIPQSGADVFTTTWKGAAGLNEKPTYKTSYGSYSGSPLRMDLSIYRQVNVNSDANKIISRTLGEWQMETDNAQQQVQDAVNNAIDWQNGFGNSAPSSASTNLRTWVWEEAPKFFSIANYAGSGNTPQSIQHELGTAPEMMWVKDFVNGGQDWMVYHSAIGNNNFCKLNEADAKQPTGSSQYWNNTAPTSTTFTVGSSGLVNAATGRFVAYLFATLDGVSKVGTYNGTQLATNIDCGFSSGARLVLIKKISSTGNWYLFDSSRGITVNADPYIVLNATTTQTTLDAIEPFNGGFALTTDATLNASGSTYIFYAIAT